MERPTPATVTTRPLERTRHPTDRERHHHPCRSRTPPQADRPNEQDAVAVVVRTRPTRPRSVLAQLPTTLRHRTHLPVREEHPRMDHTIGVHTRTGRPLDLADHRRLHTAPPRPKPRRRPPAPMGTTPRPTPTQPRPRPQRVSTTWHHHRHTRQPTETRQSRTRTPKRHPKTPTNPPPSHQKGSLTRNNKV